jgi:hypothetical protein
VARPHHLLCLSGIIRKSGSRFSEKMMPL